MHRKGDTKYIINYFVRKADINRKRTVGFDNGGMANEKGYYIWFL